MHAFLSRNGLEKEDMTLRCVYLREIILGFKYR